MTCPHCNAHKWTTVEGLDPETQQTVRLFHPRTDTWAAHFAWSSHNLGELIGLSPIGRATLTTLRINDEDMIVLRRLLAEVGLFAEASVAKDA